ncbi:NAD-dependent epimerase/dehydratase family protein [Neolewinella litorea]|uniref:NAD-dependent epimerase/dehydratase family protein n=1 Tax=Neolewinella litorea TaxID=2562452 RepID=A0A4S4NZQ4_9BACT|nr:NAD-dependent epimerase/dehydratase family protein [Neolewinella litorea]THH41790.1 NAD-dependent epimerase/dehydratase family protein [Neolewinella litorea]
MPPSILLTGATGFIGYYLSRALAASGRPFATLVREGADTGQLTELGEWCTLREGDVTDPESLVDALAGIDTVIHAAARVSYQPGEEDEMLRVNAGGTANLVNMMLEAGTPRLVYLSSVAALNRVDGGSPTGITDRWPLDKIPTAYGRSKFAAEREVWRGQAEGLSVAALYPSVVLGAGDWKGSNTPALWRRAADGARAYPLGANGFVDVRDVAAAVLAVLDRNLDRDRFLLSAANLTWREALTAIAESISAPPPSYAMPRWQSSLLWPLEGLRARATGQTPLITLDSHRTVQSTYRYDGSRYVWEIGKPYIPIADSIREIGRAFHLSRTIGEELPATYVPLLAGG